MAAMIADSNCILPLSGKPNADYEQDLTSGVRLG
jgi:hypothetical protein